MTLEQICVNKEWAEKLKEAGFPQESLFYWCTPEGGQDKDRFIACTEDAWFCNQDTCSFNHNYIAAPTASEILEKLPSFIVLDTNKTWLSCSKNIFNLFEVGYATNGGFINGHMEEKSLVDALARMYCYLVSEKLTKKD